MCIRDRVWPAVTDIKGPVSAAAGGTITEARPRLVLPTAPIGPDSVLLASDHFSEMVSSRGGSTVGSARVRVGKAVRGKAAKKRATGARRVV